MPSDNSRPDSLTLGHQVNRNLQTQLRNRNFSVPQIEAI
jgi:hypothetical protein